MEWLLALVVLVVASAVLRFVWAMVQAFWWKHRTSTWAERQRERLRIAIETHDQFGDRLRSGDQIMARDAIKFEASLHALADGQRKDRPDNPAFLDLHAATVRFIELQRDMIADVRKTQGANLPALHAEADRVDAFLGAQWRNPSVSLAR